MKPEVPLLFYRVIAFSIVRAENGVWKIEQSQLVNYFYASKDRIPRHQEASDGVTPSWDVMLGHLVSRQVELSPCQG